MSKFLRVVGWAWIIIVGGLMITPGGISCIVCGPLGTKVAGVISVLLGAAGLLTGRSAGAARA